MVNQDRKKLHQNTKSYLNKKLFKHNNSSLLFFGFIARNRFINK